MNFPESVEYLMSLGNEVETMKLGLENIRKLLSALGNPQNNYLKVQVAGTNGKGSVCAFLDSICLRAEIKAGVFTSPHLVSITERIRIGGFDISEGEFSKIATRVRDVSEKLVSRDELETVPTYFEQVTAIALVAFSEAKVDLAILETGLGGRFDAVTAVEAEICAITRIDLDHQEYLGNTIEEIAAEKAAIINKETLDVVIGAQSRTVMALLRERCRKFGIKPINDGYDPWRLLTEDAGSVTVSLTTQVFRGVQLGLVGKHQVENAQTAVQIAEALRYRGLPADMEDEREVQVVEGLKNVRNPGRLEWFGRFLLDGAHNAGGAKALRAYLDENVARPITIVFGAMKDKRVREIASELFPKAEKIVLTEAANSRAMTTAELTELAPVEIGDDRLFQTESIYEAIKVAQDVSPEDGVILVTGSLYLVGEARGILTG